jgi:hypothetical protein
MDISCCEPPRAFVRTHTGNSRRGSASGIKGVLRTTFDDMMMDTV